MAISNLASSRFPRAVNMMARQFGILESIGGAVRIKNPNEGFI